MANFDINKGTGVTGVLVLDIAGAISIDDKSALQNAIQQIMKGNSFFIICDMSKVESVDASFVGMLLEFRRDLLSNNGNLVLASLKLDVLEYLNSLEEKLIFKIYNDVKNALDYYKWEYEGVAEEIVLSFPPDLALVPPIRQFAKRISEDKGYGKKDTFRIETIVDEICNNAVEHGSEALEEDVALRILIDREKIEISVTNKSRPEKGDDIRKMAKFLNQPNTSIEDSRGRGLALVRMLSNDVKIENSEEGTSVHVTKIREE